MLIRDYCDFVGRTDWTRDHDFTERLSIAEYGIASETGSLVSAVKKKLLSSTHGWDQPNDEVLEELGDVLWYAAMVASLYEGQTLVDIARSDLAALPTEIDKDPQFKAALDQQNYDRFLRESAAYLLEFTEKSFSEYQDLAILTARTQGRDLLHVCLTRLLFYSTVMLSKGFPQVEKLMQTDILQLPLERTLGMILWHVSAVARLFGKTLDEVAQFNITKLKQLYNVDGEPPTKLHDELPEVPNAQKLPRHIDVSFVTVGPGRLQMYSGGLRLGDELTDNSREDDGYRFHDIMHLANAAKLGWSPVLRSLMKRKRKFNPEIDNSEDGARAQIVEEAVVKAVHSKGVRIGGEQSGSSLFTSKEQIPSSFLKLIRSFVKGLEVSKNHLWEWQEAIVEGHKIYSALRQEGQGTVRVNLEERTIAFDPNVAPALKGVVVGTGIGQGSLEPGAANRLTAAEKEELENEPRRVARLLARKNAILSALNLSSDDSEIFAALRVNDVLNGGVSIKASGGVQKAIWNIGAISFQTVDLALEHEVLCYAVALGDLPK